MRFGYRTRWQVARIVLVKHAALWDFTKDEGRTPSPHYS